MPEKYTVKQLQEKLAEFPDDAIVSFYVEENINDPYFYRVVAIVNGIEFTFYISPIGR